MRAKAVFRFCVAFAATMFVIMQGGDLVLSTAQALRNHTAPSIMPIGMR